MDKKYYKLLDIIRIVSCIGVLFYHLGYLKGGFLSVCTFFVLSGYLAYISLSKKDKVSLLDYYKKRFIHIYLPLIIVVFSTTCLVSYFKDIHWFQLKPETTSVLLGYNNYWQLSVNQDYFARHISSPFMHFWYIGILLQFELLIPFIYQIIKFIKNKIGKIIPIILLTISIIGSIFYFINCNSIMTSYYDSFARSFSLLLGVLLGYITKEYKNLSIKKYSNIFFYIYLLLLIIPQFIIDSNSKYYAIMMIITSLITCRLISYATTIESKNKILDKPIKYLSSITYEIYLFQYPVLFFIQYLNLPNELKLTTIILTTLLLSIILHFSLDFKNKKTKIIKILLCIIIGIISSYGIFQYVEAKDYTEEMNNLKKQLSDNEELIKSKQKDYEERLKQENDNWNNVLNDLENGEKQVSEYVSNLPITGVGDSVMLGATPTLYQTFPNGHFDAAVSRTDYEANRILLSFKSQNLLSNDVLIHLGTNGQCGLKCQKEIMATCGDSHVYIVTVSNDLDVHVNQTLYKLKEMYPNITIIDWYNASLNHREYFVSDGVHLTKAGMAAYTQTIYDGIYNYYYQEFEKKKEKILKEHEEALNQKIDFYGNHTLLNIYTTLQEIYENSRFTVQENYTINDLIDKLNKEIQDNTISKNIVISIDQEDTTINDYQKIIDLATNQNIYFIYINHNPYNFKNENVVELDFYKEIKNNKDYLMVDGIHLSDKGNKRLIKFIQEEINKRINN